MTPPLAPHLVALALVVGDMLVRAARIRLLMPNARLSLWQAIAVNAYGEAAAAVTPARLGGDPARFLGFRRTGVDTPSALAGLGVETLIDWALLAAASLVLGLAFADTGAAGVRRLVHLAASKEARLLVVGVLGLLVVGAMAARWYRRRLATGPALSLAEAWRRALELGWRTVGIAASCTAMSIVAQTAILPILVGGSAGIDTRAVVLGSFALLYGQLFLPTPAGAGGVELGFVGGFAGALSAGELAALLLAWRVYTLMLGAGLGGVLLARSWLARSWSRRRYNARSSLKVRSQL